MTRIILAITALIIASANLLQAAPLGYGKPANFSDVVLIYAGNQNRNVWDKEQLTPYVTHTYSDGSEDWMFDAFLFLEFVRTRDVDGVETTFGFGNGMGGKEVTTQADWEWILDQYFTPAKSKNATKLAALDQLITEKSATLGKPDFRHKVIIVCPAPKKGKKAQWTSDPWGEIDGQTINLKKSADRLSAVKWYIDRLVERWDKAGYKNIDLEGVYWIEESMISNADIIADVNDYVRSKGLRSYWIPYYRDGNDKYCTRWKEFGFDMCYYQPNYAFYTADGNTMPKIQLNLTCQGARRTGAGLELEFETSGSSNALHSVDAAAHQRINDYMDVFTQVGVTREGGIAYYVGSRGLNDMAKSTDEVDHATIDRMARMIKSRRDAMTGKPIVFPTPQSMSVGKGTYKFIDGKINVSCPDAFSSAPDMLSELLGDKFTVNRVKRHADIDLAVDRKIPAGGYTMQVDKHGIKIKASNYEGAAAAIATVIQLLPTQSLTGDTASAAVPFVTITDAPKYEWRGLLFDSSRHFWTVEEAKRQLKVMALFKLNRFHWHLTDSQEWRIPMDGYPQFEMGCYRPLDGYIDAGVMERKAKTGNPDFDFPADRLRLTEPGDTVYGGKMSAEMRISEGGDTIYGGRYSREDIAEVIAYADMLGIEVVPEIDMPGHFRGASKLLPWLSCDHIPFAAVCIGRDSTLDFCKHVLKEVMDMFPSQRIHIGGDEVDRSHWRTCPDCQHRADSLGLESTDQLQAWFVREIAQFVKDNGHEVLGWQEIADDGFKEGSQATIMWWLGEDPGVVRRAIAKGFDVICCPRQNVYLDYDENAKSLRKILDLRPSEFCDSADAPGHIKGIQGNMWTEWVPSLQRLEYMIWPRLMAISHMGWIEASIPTDEYYKLAEPQFRRMDAYGVHYHVPDPEGFSEHNVLTGFETLSLTNHVPYIPIHYTTDGSEPTLESPLYTAPIHVIEPTHFRFGAFRHDGRCINMFDAYYELPNKEISE